MNNFRNVNKNFYLRIFERHFVNISSSSHKARQTHSNDAEKERFRMASYNTSQQKNVLVVGLGNPDMPDTRHSIGMTFVNKLAARLNIGWQNERKLCGGMVAVHSITGTQKVVLLKPKIAMNLNGKSVRKTANHFDIEPEDVYLIHDELDKSVGKFSFKYGGSARGHNGVKSVQSCMKSEAMPRLLVGIDRPASKSEVAEYVLQKFDKDEIAKINEIIDNCIDALNLEIEKKYGIPLLPEDQEKDDGIG